MSETMIARFRAAILLIAPAVVLAGLAYHPHIGNPIDADFVARLAAAVEADATRWAVAHLVVAVGSGLLALAFLAIRGRLREAGEERWSAWALPFAVMGSVMYALLPAMEFAPVAAAGAGADVGAVQAALAPWFVPILFTAALIFAIGALGFAKGIAASGLLSPARTRLVVGALVVMAFSRFVPLAMVQFYLQAAAGVVALWPLASGMSQDRWARPAARPRSAPAA